MMTLSDVLSARADNARACAQIDCGALGALTLEALPLRELERYGRSADADRAIFYAACRDLQRTGAELLKAGKVYRPDQVTALVSDAEAAKAADAVRALSGVRVEQTQTEEAGTEQPETEKPEREEPKTEQSEAERVHAAGEETEEELSEVRPEVVQENSEVRQKTVQDMGDDGQIRLDTVRQNVTQFNEFRHGFVQNAEMTERVKAEDGQVSREFLTEELTENAKPDKTQVLWSETAQTPQNVVEMDKTDGSLRNIEPVADNKSAKQKRKKSNRAHESKSESAEEVHEDTSELTSAEVLMLHEITSEFAEELHETTSDFRRGEVREMHESTSEFVETLHETESEYRETVHENESERAERVARELLEGLRRAAWVR